MEFSTSCWTPFLLRVRAISRCVEVVYQFVFGRVGIGSVIPGWFPHSFTGSSPLDPTTCYTEMLTSMRDGDTAAAREHAMNLQHWLNRGGFCPQGYSLTEVKGQLARVLRVTAAAQR